MQIFSRHLLKPILFHNSKCNTIKPIKQQFKTLIRLTNGKQQQQQLQQKRFLLTRNNIEKTPSTKLLYTAAFVIGTSLGVMFGYLYNFNAQFYLRGQDANTEEGSQPPAYEIDTDFTGHVTNTNSAYTKFPFKITLYQFDTSPYSSQIRAYLDYFGFNYTFIEVDPSTKIEVKAITRRPKIPIVTLEHDDSHRKWYLTNSTTIMSVFETLRNAYDAQADSFHDSKYLHELIKKHLPTLTNEADALKFPNKYLIEHDNENLNDINWRKWINNTALPVIRWNSCDTIKHAFELVDMYQLRSQWDDRFNPLRRMYLYYSFASKSYREKNKFKKEVEGLDTDSFSSPIEALDAVIKTWEDSLHTVDNNKELLFHGENGPNLADISMFGIMRAFDGCELFREAVEKNVKFYKWLKNMQILVASNDGGNIEHKSLKNIEKTTRDKKLTQKELRNINEKLLLDQVVVEVQAAKITI